MASWAQLGLLAILAGLTSATLIVLLRPLLARYALAQPNARSSHSTPTPQGCGIAVVAAVILVCAGVVFFSPATFMNDGQLAIVLAATLALAIVGVTDDVRPLEAAPRLALQAVAVCIVIAALPEQMRIFPSVPWWAERLCLLVGGVWFVNLVNFMDGIDWMTVAEIVPVTATLALFGLMQELPPDGAVVAIVLCGAIIGFAPFNRPVARLFLGDVGSLPIGLLVGWLLVLLAGRGHLAAALLLPLYYLADATITVVRRFVRGEAVTQAHRGHFYQRAADQGRGKYRVVGPVFGANILLSGLAALSLGASSVVQVACLAGGMALVGALLWDLNRKPRRSF